MAKIVILNGPAGCGKDTIANALMDKSIVDHIASFKQPLFDVALGVLGASKFNTFMALYSNRETKERPANILNGLSPRQFFIDISEKFIKPMFGDDYMGVYLADYLLDCSGTVVVPDGGFYSEIPPLVDAGHSVHVVRLYRNGFSFDGDSRSHILAGDRFKIADVILKDGEIKEAVEDVAYRAGLTKKSVF